MNKTPKRFIAGAVCPRCAELDKLVMYRNEEQESIRECVRCGYQDVMTDTGPQELSTRVNQPRAGEQPLAHEDEVQVVNILDGSSGVKPSVNPSANPGVKRKDH